MRYWTETTHLLLHTVTCLALMAGRSEAQAPPPRPAPERQLPACSTAKTNEIDCVVTINRERPVTPLPVKATPGTQVTVRVSRRPLDVVQFNATFADTVPADPLAAIFKAFITPVSSLVAGVKSPMVRAATEPVAPPPPEAAPPTEAENVDAILMALIADQEDVEKQLAPVVVDVKNLGKRLSDVRNWPAAEADGTGGWMTTEFEAFRTGFICAATGAAGTHCGVGFPVGGLAGRLLPGGVLDAMGVTLKRVRERFAALPAADRATLATKMNTVANVHQELLASVASLRTALTALGDTADTLGGLTNERFTSREYGRLPDGTSRTATVKLSAKDVINKETTELGTVVVAWGGTRFELSGGAVFSVLPARSFENALLIENGQPIRNDKGGILTQVVETHQTPMVIPAMLAHFRYAERDSGGRRIAWLLTAGVGVNPYSGSADFVASPFTFSYRGLMVSPLLHLARDIRLTGGLTPGAELGADPPDLTTERFWKLTFAIGLSYRIPFD